MTPRHANSFWDLRVFYSILTSGDELDRDANLYV